MFDDGVLRHQENATRAAYDQAAAEYRNTLVTALQDVADTLSALRLDATTLSDNAEAATAAGESLRISLAQYKYGAISQIVMLTTQQAHLQAELALSQSRADRLADTVALFQALGGGWWNSKESEAPHQPSWHPDKGLAVLLP